jgi:Tol biopolymer transport system component
MVRLAVLLLAGCGRVGFDAVGLAPGNGDGSLGDGDLGDGAMAGSCLAAWHTGPVLSAPVRIAELASAGDDDDPWVSDDGLRIYFAQTAGNNSDLFVAARTSPTGTFTTPTALTTINSNQNELRPWLSADEKTVTYVSARAGSMGFDLWTGSRTSITDTFGSPTLTAFASINTAGADMDPAVSADGLRLYYSMPPQTNQSLGLATRATDSDPFGAATLITELNDAQLPDLDPAPSRDELVMAFTSFRGGGFHIYYATRASRTHAWGAPQEVPGVNDSLGDDRSPYLTADGCALYFTSSRSGGAGGLDLYVATLQL